MKKAPRKLTTQRLILKPPTIEDADTIQRLAGSYTIARYTLNIPHPYEDGMAEVFIQSISTGFAVGNSLQYGVYLPDTLSLIGMAGLSVYQPHGHAEIGYWIAEEYWGQGYATEASKALVNMGFQDLKLHHIIGEHMPENTASRRVMEHLGMQYEGTLREHVPTREGGRSDLDIRGILRSEWETMQAELIQ